MTRIALFPLLATLVATLPSAVAAAHRETIGLDEAKADPDFAVQGEYLGRGALFGANDAKLAAQVIARGHGNFEIFLLPGGLPGDGWKKGDPRVRCEGRRHDRQVAVQGDGLSGEIVDGKMRLNIEGRENSIELKRTERKSPTLGAKAPQGAVVLFDGSGVDYFPGAKMTEEKDLLSGTLSKAEFNSYHLHLEFRLTWMPDAQGQARSNSGVYIHNCYEVQVLDSFGLEGRDNECGGLYGIKEPDVNMCLPPMVWQTYDVDFTAPKFDDEGERRSCARLTLRHNGVPIHDLELPRATPGGQEEGPGPRGIQLQGHGCHVQYRNIWLERRD